MLIAANNLLIIFIPIILGYFSRKYSKDHWKFEIDAILSNTCISLVFIMGVFLGLNIKSNGFRWEIFEYSIYYSILLILANIITIMLFIEKRSPEKFNEDNLPSKHKKVNFFKKFTPIMVLIFGAIIGTYTDRHYYNLFSSLMFYILSFLLFLIGFDLKQKNIKVIDLFLNKNGILLSTVILFSSAIVSIALPNFIDIELKDSIAISSGFGWASFSGVFVTSNAGPVIGSIAFLVDLIRGWLVIALIPIFYNKSPMYLVGYGGGTSMDVSLPILRSAYGESIVPMAISSGFILTISTPIIQSLVYSLFLSK